MTSTWIMNGFCDKFNQWKNKTINKQKSDERRMSHNHACYNRDRLQNPLRGHRRRACQAADLVWWRNDQDDSNQRSCHDAMSCGNAINLKYHRTCDKYTLATNIGYFNYISQGHGWTGAVPEHHKLILPRRQRSSHYDWFIYVNIKKKKNVISVLLLLS